MGGVLDEGPRPALLPPTRSLEASNNERLSLPGSLQLVAAASVLGQGMGTGSDSLSLTPTPPLTNMALLHQSSLRPAQDAPSAAGSGRHNSPRPDAMTGFMEAAAARLSEAIASKSPPKTIGPLEVNSVRPSESQVPEENNSKPQVLLSQQSQQFAASPQHQLPPVGSQGSPAQGHSYLPLPGWMTAQSVASTTPPATAGGCGAGRTSSGVPSNALHPLQNPAGAGSGVRFFLEGARPPTASGTNGVLAARARLTMRQSAASGNRVPTPLLGGPLEVIPSPCGSFVASRDASASPGPESVGQRSSIPGRRSSATNTYTNTSVPRTSEAPSSPGRRSTGCGGPPASPGASSAKRKPSMLEVALAPWRRWALTIMNHLYFYWALVFLTFFIIFEDDFKKACLPPYFDLPLEITITCIFVLFSLEMAASSLLRPGYFLGFYFILDAVATSSLVFEVPTVRYKFFGGSEYINLADGGSFIKNAGAQLYISSKAGRVARIFRLLRMLRLYSMYQQYVRRRRILEAAAASATPVDVEQLSIIEFEMQQEQERKTKVGQKLEELTTRRIIVAVLIMILLIPSFDIRLGTFGVPRTVGESGLRMLHGMALAKDSAANTDIFDVALEAFKTECIFNAGTKATGFIYGLTIANKEHVALRNDSRRFEELYSMAYSSNLCRDDPGFPGPNASLPRDGKGCVRYDSFAVYDWRWYSQVSAMLNIARSLFIIVLLVFGAYMLNRDSRNLVLLPIERMIQRVQEMAENPLAMAESRLQLQAPWQDKLQNLNDASGRGGSGLKRDSLPLNGPGSVAAAPMAGAAAAAAAVAGGRADGVAIVHCGEPYRVAGSVAGGSVAKGLGGTGAGAGHHTTITVYDAAVAAANVGKRMSTLGPEGLVVRTSFMQNNSNTAAARLAAKLARGRDRLRSAAVRVWTFFWDGPDGEDEANAAAATGGAMTAGAYETEILENSIAKIGALLAIGFGDAGAEIIAENIRNDGDINPMVPGKRTVAIFGFCDIRRFTDTTEVLQAGVMEFVNSIAHIVHTSVSTHGGSPNKNIGDAFLLVWKFPRGFKEKDINPSMHRGRPDRSTRHAPTSDNFTLSPAGSFKGAAAAPPPPPPPAAPPTQSSGISITAALLGGLSRKVLPIGSNARVAPSVPGSIGGGGEALAVVPAGHFHGPMGHHGHAPMGSMGMGPAKISSSLANTVSLAQLVDEGFGLSGTEGPHPLTNKMTILKALMSLKRDVGISQAAKREVVAAIADNALASFVLINLAIKKSARLRKYAMRDDLNERMPNFSIAMGFGLHVGWAIEGAIGSEYKIDASYLSPNVNMASRLEAATKQFGVVLLLSGDFVECLSNGLREKVRQIDCVLVKGSKHPMPLYTYDINLDAVSPPTPEQVEAGDDSGVDELMWQSYSCSNEWVENPELASSWGINWDFKETFDQGFFAYRVGNWPEARRYLEECRTALRDASGIPRVDGPSDVLLRFMSEHGYTAPPWWRGFRELTEK